MKTIQIPVTKRELMSKNELNRFRSKGNIPAVLYGRHLEKNLSVSIDYNNFNKILKTHGRVILLDFKSEDKELSGRTTMIKEIQKDCLTDNILHVDLIEVKQDEKLSVNIKLNFIGTPIGVKEKGGVLDLLRRNINISCLPSKIPQQIDIDLSQLDLGEALHISDLKIPEGIEVLDASDISIASVYIPRAVEEKTEETIVEGEEEKTEVENKEIKKDKSE
jgi:large subunit ribosomal protein L25